MKTFSVKENTTLKAFTDSTYPQGSFYFTALLKKGDIKVNAVRAHKDMKVFAGDIIVYYTTPSEEAKKSHDVIYEDENILVADKESGVSSEALFCELAEVAPYPVHRLDRNTEGVIVLAKTEAAQRELIGAFKSRTVEKTYLCLVKNNLKVECEKLTAYLFDDNSGKVKISDVPKEGYVKIITEYEVIKREGDIALLKVKLHTGKTHQIRAHLAHIGCPVLGDTKYGDFVLNKKYKLTRQQLLSKSLQLPNFPQSFTSSKTLFV